MKILRRYWWLSAIALAFVLFEGGLRLFFGLGYPVLSMKDTQTGYRFQPNQDRRRFGKKQQYNQYSQRSDKVVLPKPDSTFRILMVGDSVLNGGTPTDQSQTITELLEAQLTATQETVEVLNASAGSWGIGNQLGYLRKFGLFESDILILQIGSHDLWQPRSESEVVGQDPNYPNHLPLLATQELGQRYLLPRLQRRFGDAPPAEIPTTADLDRQFQENMTDLREIIDLARRQSVMVYVLYTPNWIDVLPQPSEPLYKQEFFAVLERLQVPVIDIQQTWANQPTARVESYFRDSVHLTVAGHKAIAAAVRSQVFNKL